MKLISVMVKPIYLLALSLLVLCSCSQPQTEVHLTGPTMGTSYNIKYVPTGGVSTEILKTQMDAELVHINQLMSTYIKDSELSRFNQLKTTEAFPMSAETLAVLQEAKRLGKLSDGLLDVTVGPLVNLWGFGPNSRPETIPTPEHLKGIQTNIGLNKLILGDTWASKTNPDLYVDLSTIAKGYGVDQVAEILETHHITNYLVEIGGEMRLSGTKPSGKAWTIAIEKPDPTQRAVQQLISLGNNALATSGDYRIYYEENGVRYSHLIDPKTGFPITHNLVSATVVHRSSMTADGLATAFMIMGKDKALALAQKENIAVFLITKEKDGFKEYTSPKFNEAVTVY